MYCANFIGDLTGQRGDLPLWLRSVIFLLISALFSVSLFGVKLMDLVQRASVRGAMMGFICGQAVFYLLEVPIGPLG